ncbi:MAG: flagellar assembly protein FliX [Roseococcus sp.]|nr:flagellar assembly protein FliX [Roseococcus sp.]
MLPPIRGFQGTGRVATPRRAASSGFALPGASAREAGATEAIASHLNMLGLQGEWSASERDAAAARRGDAVLRELAALQLGLLEGRLDSARLNRLALLAEGELGADPALQEIIAAISLRARIELARVHA